MPILAGATEFDEAKIKEVYDVLFVIDEHYFPNGNEWIAGENVTVADFAYIATVSSLVVSFNNKRSFKLFVLFAILLSKLKPMIQQSSFATHPNFPDAHVKSFNFIFRKWGHRLESIPEFKPGSTAARQLFPSMMS